MDMYPDILRRQIDELNKNLSSVNASVEGFSKSSDGLQSKLILWTQVMAFAAMVQAAAIVLQIFLGK